MEHSVESHSPNIRRHLPGLLALLAPGVLAASCTPRKSPTSNTAKIPAATSPVSSPKNSAASSTPLGPTKQENVLEETLPPAVSPVDLHELEQAVKAHPQDSKALARYGSALVESGKGPEGISFLRRAVAIQPTLTAAWHNLGLAAEKQSWLDVAADAYKHVVAAKPEMAGEWIKLGYALLPLGRFDEAERAFQRASALQPGSSKVLIALASTEFAYFNYDAAIANLKRATALNPRSDAAQADLASIELDRGKREAAEAAIRAACALAPQIPQHALLLARILVDSPKIENRVEAKTELKRASSLGREDGTAPLKQVEIAQIEYLLGSLENRDGNKDRSLAHWRRSYALDPTQPTTLLALGHALLARGGSQAAEGSRLLDAYQRAQSLRDRARILGQQAEMHPSDGLVRFEYGKLLMEQNNLVPAVWELHEAVRLRRKDIRAKRLLAIALRHVGRFDEADALGK